jgi:NAD+ synthase (glutamine-hydrolysing)
MMRNLGVTSKTVPIKDAVLQHFKDIGHDPADFSVTYENAQARERTQVLMDIANKEGGIVLGTGDLSEAALGWCTYNGDQMSMYNVNADIPKTLVRWIIASVAEANLMPEATDVLLRVLDTPISPELLPPDAVGKIAQKTEDIVGPYALHDFFLYYAARYQYTPTKIFELAKKAFEGHFDGATVKKWLTVFFCRFFTQQFKRNAMPDGVKVGSVSLCPRGDWHMPSDASAALWLAEIEAIEV